MLLICLTCTIYVFTATSFEQAISFGVFAKEQQQKAKTIKASHVNQTKEVVSKISETTEDAFNDESEK